MTSWAEKYVATKRRRRRALRLMLVLFAVCAMTALAIGAQQLHSEGLRTFLTRPAGVGASPPEASPVDTAATQALPSIVRTPSVGGQST